MKCICIIRVSTDRQDILQQKEEMTEFIKLNGYDEITWIEGVGASAIKLNDKYIKLLNDIKTIIETTGIKVVFLWHLNRLGRNDAVLIDLKNYFINNKVQLIVKEPSLKLLNDDGSVNTGAELAYGLFATMVKQDMQEKIAKFKRAKDYKRAQGKCVTGKVLFGYTIDENHFIIEDKEKADIVRLIFQLYATGDYSEVTLRDELKARGINITGSSLSRMIKQKAYMGDSTGLYHKFPAIISKELFDKVATIRKTNNLNIPKGERICLGSKILKCAECGGNFFGESGHYVCYHARKRMGCESRYACDLDVVDSILWNVASMYHMEYLLSLNKESIVEYENELEVVQNKIEVALKKKQSIDNRKNRVMDSYFKEEISMEMKDKWLANINKDNEELNKTIHNLNEERDRIMVLIESIQTDINLRTDKEVDITMNVLEETDKAKMKGIVKKHILRAILGPSAVEVENYTYKGFTLAVGLANGQEWTFFYAANKRVGNKLYKLTENAYQPYTIDKVNRQGGIGKETI